MADDKLYSLRCHPLPTAFFSSRMGLNLPTLRVVNFDHRTRLRIAPVSCLALVDAERAESRQGHVITALACGSDAVHDGFHRLTRFCLAEMCIGTDSLSTRSALFICAL